MSLHDEVPREETAVRPPVAAPNPGPPVEEPTTVDVGCVVLSMGDRGPELSRAVESLLRQTGVTVRVIVVGNGWDPQGLPDGVDTLALEDNVGIPAGRNIGAAAAGGDFILFLDDDAALRDPDTLQRALARFRARPEIGVMQPQIKDFDGSVTPTRWVPRLRATGRDRAGDVAVLWEGVSLVRRSAFETIGGWAGVFFYGHEGIELAWRMVDAGYTVHYAADLIALHPATLPTRHHYFYVQTARNRVWVARRNLPLPVAAVYLSIWTTATILRTRRWSEFKDAMVGFGRGFREPCGARRPISYRAVWRMARVGRPPIV